jgi:hypothetical protein
MYSLIRRTPPMALVLGIFLLLVAFAAFAFRNVM